MTKLSFYAFDDFFQAETEEVVYDALLNWCHSYKTVYLCH
jgi:hypothetical protein